MKKKYEFKPVKADKYFDKKLGVYRFPFEVLDKTPGGSNLGRIEWNIEPIMAKRKKDGFYRVEKIYLWARQTRDKRYEGKVFEIPCYSESIFSSPTKGDSFFKGVWKIGFCPMHKTLVLEAYADDNNYKALHIRTCSSIGVDIEFVKE
jgi:hypothetical protein